MKRVLLDGCLLRTEAQVHEELARELGFPPWYGGNLDALYDCLTALCEECEVVLAGPDALAGRLGGRAAALRRVLRDASAANTRFIYTEQEPKQKKQEEANMEKIKFYGAPICRDCRDAHALLEAKGIETEYLDITASVANLRAFLALRDNDPAFAQMKQEGRIGIPAFVWPDGSVTLGIEWLQGESSCKNC